MFCLNNVVTRIVAVRSCTLTPGVLMIVLAASCDAQANSKISSHPPQRPLPVAIDRDLARGVAYYVDPARGDDKNIGSINKPWRTMQHGARQLKAGDTLYLRGGIYHESVYLTQSGTPEAPIVIAAYPKELPVLDGGLPEFLESPATSWKPASGGAPNEYVSTKTYPDTADRQIPQQFLPGAWEPMWGKEEQRPLALGHFADSMVPLHGYRNVADLRSTNELNPGKKNAGGVYCGPGLWFNRQNHRIHVRLAHHSLPGLGKRAYRGETDPRKLPLVVAVGFGKEVLRINGIKHVRIEGLVLRGATGSPMIHLYGSQHVHLDHLTVHGGFPGLLINASQNVQVTHSAFRGLAAPWLGRSHMKYRGTASYQIVLQNGQPYNENIEFAYCEFTDDHDFAFLRYAKNLQFHHNFVDNFNDDGLECGAKLRWHTMFIHHNRIGACLGVFQQHEIDKDESPDTHDPGSGLYVYRNVFDQRAGVYYGLPGKPDPIGAFLHHEGALLSDHGSPTYPVMRIYHNTFLRRTPAWRNYFLFGLGARGMRSTERDVFNNLFVQANRVPGAVVHGKKASPLREGGNLLWGVKEGPMKKVDPFARLRKSPLFEDSRRFYKPGWTTHDIVADPRFVKLADHPSKTSDLRLSRGSPAINAGVSIPKTWPNPLAKVDQDRPDIGAIPFGAQPWGVGVDGRIPLFGGEWDSSSLRPSPRRTSFKFRGDGVGKTTVGFLREPPKHTEKFHVYAPSRSTNKLLIVEASPSKMGLSLKLTRQVDLGFPAATITAHPDKALLYVAAARGKEGKTPGAVVFLDRKGNDVRHQKVTLHHGYSYLSLDRASHFLLGANYFGGFVDTYALDKNGIPTKRVAALNEGRRNAHCVLPSPGNQYVYIPYVKETNAIFQYRFDPKTGKLKPLKRKNANPPAGTGPRHIAYHPDKPIVYFSNEQHLGVSVYDVTPSGALKIRQVCNAVASDKSRKGLSSSDIVITPDGRFLFAGIRGHKQDFDRISRYRIKANGNVELLGLTQADKIPWGLALSPDGRYLLVTAFHGATLTAYRIGADGDLKKAASLRWDRSISDLVTR